MRWRKNLTDYNFDTKVAKIKLAVVKFSYYKTKKLTLSNLWQQPLFNSSILRNSQRNGTISKVFSLWKLLNLKFNEKYFFCFFKLDDFLNKNYFYSPLIFVKNRRQKVSSSLFFSLKSQIYMYKCVYMVNLLLYSNMNK